MKTTYINNEGIKCGFNISNCGRWVDCFKGNEGDIINSFFTFGRGTTNSRPNIIPQYSKKEIALQQRFAVLFRGQKLVLSECDKLILSISDLEHFEQHKGKNHYYTNNFLDHLNTLTKDREKTIRIYRQLLEM